MLKQKNESPINLEQLSALMASYADKRREQTDNNKLDSYQGAQDSENTDEEENEEDVDAVPYFPDNSSKRCETEPTPKVNKQQIGDKKAKGVDKDDDQNMANIQRNLKQLEGKLQNSNQQKPSSASPKKQTDSEKRLKTQDDENEGFEPKRGSQSPKKNSNLMSNLIKNPRSLNKNDDPPITPISEDLREKIQGFSTKTTSPSKSNYKEISPKKGRDYSPITPQKSARDQQPVTPKNNRDVTPKGARSIASDLKSSSQKTLDPSSQKSIPLSSSAKNDKTKVKKNTKKVKKVKGKDDKSVGTEKSVKKSKKSQGTDSELSSQAVATIGSKNGLEGWRSPPQDVQDVADEEVFMTNPEDEERDFDNVEDRQANDYEEDKAREQPGEQTFGTDHQDTEEKHGKEHNRSKDYESYASQKSNRSQKSRDNLEASNGVVHENDALNKEERSRRGSELDKSNGSQDQFMEFEREVCVERGKPQAEKAKAHAAVPRNGSEYSRSQLSKAVLEEEEEQEKSSDEEQLNSVRSRGQVDSRNKVSSQKSSINNIDDEVKSQKATSHKDQVANPNQRGSKSLFSNQNHRDERQSILSNNPAQNDSHKDKRQSNYIDHPSQSNQSFNENSIDEKRNDGSHKDKRQSNYIDHPSQSNQSFNENSIDEKKNDGPHKDKRQSNYIDHPAQSDSYKDKRQSNLINNTAQSKQQLTEKSIDEEKNEDSFYSNDSQIQSRSTIRESTRAKEENNTKALKKGSFDDQNSSRSTNKNQRKGEEHRGAPAEYASSQAGSEHAGYAATKNFESEQPRASRKNAPLRCEVMNTESIEIQPPSNVTKQQYTKYAMDGSDKNLTSASSRGLKAMAEHVVQKFKNYDAQIKQTKKEFKVSVSRSESRSRSPETQEPQSNKKTQKVQPYRTPEKKDVKVRKDELESRDLSAHKKTRASVMNPMTPEKIETSNGKKAAHLKRNSVAAPVKSSAGKKEV